VKAAVANSPFIRDVPAAQALEAWRAAREAAGCPERLPAIEVPLIEAAGLVTAAPVWATRSSPPFDAAGMDGIAVRSADTIGSIAYQYIRGRFASVASSSWVMSVSTNGRRSATGNR